MTVDKTFVDTNVLVYAHNADASSKHERAKLRIADLWSAGAGVVSLQVLQELYVNLTRKVSAPLDKATARELVRTYASWLGDPPDAALVIRASEIEELHRLSFWDALIVASAHKAGAQVLLSEDLNDGQVIEGVRVENPFRPT
jgi:predicted nucleic acid-binding protein